MTGVGEGEGPGSRLLEFVEVMARLRAECDWKRAQTHRSLARYLIEETWETLEAIDSGAESGDWAHLREELGDLLLQVYFHAVIAEEAGEFTIDDVAAGIIEKMKRRNPHVYGDPSGATPTTTGPASVLDIWESVKATEKHRSSPLDGLPPGLPALLMADKVLDRLSREVPDFAPRSAKHGSSRGQSSAPAQDIGERLLALVAEARDAGVDPEQALRDAVRRLA